MRTAPKLNTSNTLNGNAEPLGDFPASKPDTSGRQHVELARRHQPLKAAPGGFGNLEIVDRMVSDLIRGDGHKWREPPP